MSLKPEQIALPLAQIGQGDPARIVIGSANAEAIDTLRHPASWPFHTAILAGPPRSGKSLLARWFATQQPHAHIIDDAINESDDALFHAWNRAQQSETPLLLTVDLTAPDDPSPQVEDLPSQDLFGARGWHIALPDLRSRLGAAMHCEIGPPDDAMLSALLESHGERRSIVLGEAALTYIVPRIERSFAAAEQVVAAIDRLSLERKTPPSRAIWRDALEAVQGPPQPHLL